ncbi:hypothetical protein BDZ97DRAFT_1901557 [Flammula alnicola]|nr:hypothetical protein BDZ97DRAFT_1901557 [Flammula alnicola]
MANPNIATEQLLELLLTLKKTTPAAARGILNSQPAIAYALITLMVSMNAINIEVFQVMPPTAAPAPISAIPLHLQAQYRTSTPPSFPGSNSLPPSSALASSSSQVPTHTPTPPYGYGTTNGQGSSAAGYGYGQQGYGYPQQQQQQPYQQQPPYQQQQPQYQQPQYQQYQQQGGYPGYPPYGGQHQPPQAPASAPPATVTPGLPDALAGIPEEQKALIMRVLAMTPEQINMLPPADRTTYIQIVSTTFCPSFSSYIGCSYGIAAVF